MKELEERIGYAFKNEGLLENALTHSSYANEKKKGASACNERLEFLGDAVLGVTVAEYLFRNEPDMPEGQMTKLRAELVCEKALKYVADQLGLGKYLLLGHGEEQNGGRERDSINADAVEAVIAAITLDGGRGEAEKFIYRFVLPRVEEFKGKQRDHKTVLQELVQRETNHDLVYVLDGESGPDHNKQFFMHVELDGRVIGKGSGKRKKDAEQEAARNALEELSK